MALVLRSEAPRLVTGPLRSFPNPPLQAAWGRGRLGGAGREPPHAGRASRLVPAPLHPSQRGPRGAGLTPPPRPPPGRAPASLLLPPISWACEIYLCGVICIKIGQVFQCVRTREAKSLLMCVWSLRLPEQFDLGCLCCLPREMRGNPV